MNLHRSLSRSRVHDQFGNTEREHDVTRVPHQIANLHVVARHTLGSRVLVLRAAFDRYSSLRPRKFGECRTVERNERRIGIGAIRNTYLAERTEEGDLSRQWSRCPYEAKLFGVSIEQVRDQSGELVDLSLGNRRLFCCGNLGAATKFQRDFTRRRSDPAGSTLGDGNRACGLRCSSTDNERTSIVIKHTNGKEVLFRQIAGAVARRIVYYVKPGQQVSRNEQFGFIKFGSRVDIFLPLGSEVVAHMGQVTKGNETVIARW